MNLNRNGMTLLEMVVTMAISSILIFGAYQMYTAISRNALLEGLKAALQSNMITATDVIGRDLRMSGFGLPGNGFRPILSSSSSDVIKVFFDDRQVQTVLRLDVSPGNSIIAVNSAQGSVAGMYVCLVQSDTVFRMITRVGHSPSGFDTLALDSMVDRSFTAAGAVVYFSTCVSYQLVTTPSKGLRRTVNGTPAIFLAAIDTIRVSPRNSAGAALTGAFENTRTVVILFGGRIPVVKSNPYTIMDSVDVGLRN